MRSLFRGRTHADFSAEVQAHLDLETDRLIADGMSPDAAGAAAQRAFGSVALVKERFYETSRWIWLDQLRQDVRYAWRGLRHGPAFVATAVMTLAIGLGLLTIAFTIVNAYVLRPFAVRDPDGLHQIVWHAAHSPLQRKSSVFGKHGFVGSGCTSIGPGVWPVAENRVKRRASASFAFTGNVS